MSDKVSSKVCEARQRAHNTWVALERFVACVEFYLPMIEDGLQDVQHPIAHKSLDKIKQELKRLADEA